MFSDETITRSESGKSRIKTAERRAFVEWISTPIEQREPRSLKAWARANGVSESAAKRWKVDTRIYAEAAERLGRHIDLELMPGAIRALGEAAGDVSNPRHVYASKVLIDYLKWHVDRTKDDATDVGSLTDSELRDLMVVALDELDDRTPVQEADHAQRR